MELSYTEMRNTERRLEEETKLCFDHIMTILLSNYPHGDVKSVVDICWVCSSRRRLGLRYQSGCVSIFKTMRMGTSGWQSQLSF